MNKDKSGNDYYEVGNIRITALENTWDDGKPGLRIQAYKGSGKSLFQGAELPIPDKASAYDFIKEMMNALEKINGFDQ